MVTDSLLQCLRRISPAVLAGVTVFCGPASPQTVPAPAPVMESAACVVRPDSFSARRGDTLRVVLADSVHPGEYGVTANPSERLIARQLFQTLVRVNCEGSLVAGAAEKWVTDDSGRHWAFTLRDDLRLWDGSKFTATDFVRGWSGFSGVDSVSAADDRTIRIRLSQSVAEPRLLGDPALALRAPFVGYYVTGWPIGTGQYRPDTTTLVTMTRLVPVDTAAALPILEFWHPMAGDQRDLLDRGADVLLTTDPSLIDYADKRGDRSSLPLPWDATYYLVSRVSIDSLPSLFASLADSIAGQELRRALSRDAVRAESRPSLRGSSLAARRIAAGGPAGRVPPLILYSPGDRTGKDLAERLVALVPGRFHWSAVPSDDKRAAHGSIGIVTSAPLNTVPAGDGSAIPLVDVRSHVILRRGSAAWVVDGDGTLRMPLPGTLPL